MRIFKITTTAILILLSFKVTYSQIKTTNKLSYNIGTRLFDIGKYNITKTVKGDSATYIANSLVEVDYLFSSYKINFVTKSYFLRDTLQYSRVDVTVNGKLDKFTETTRKNGFYEIVKMEDGKTNTNKLNVPVISITSSTLYFNEPAKTSQNYAELYGYFNKIESTGKNKYKLTDQKTSRITEYEYKKGAISKTRIDYPLMTFGLTREKEK